MKRGTSFKAQYRQAPTRTATPPPPAWEPLSPMLHPTEPSTTHSAGGNHGGIAHGSRYANGGAINAPTARETGHASLQLSPPAVTYEPSSRSAPLPQPPPQYSLPLESPIEALADAAVSSQRTSPAHVEPPRRASHAATSPTTAPHTIGERAPKHVFARDHTYSYNERPAKRARSEYHTSPPYGQHQSRPATSHIPGYNVEQMMDNGTRMYQESRAAPPQQSSGGDKMLSDAELLLFFSNVSATAAQTPPSTAKRWSISQPSPVELPPQQARQSHEPSSPYATKAHISSHPQQLTQDLPDVNLPDVNLPDVNLPVIKPVPELVSHPSEEPPAASASQTQTPPEDALGGDSLPPVQEAAPTDDVKAKKHQGWPKGKPRGPRTTPSASKRKRSTPKPKNASTASTSAGPDQLQSPRSLQAEQPAAIAIHGNDSVLRHNAQSNPTSPQNRRHSFSTSLPQLSTNGASSISFRARSVPLGGTHTATAPVDDLARPTKKTVVEQPDLICAACKSSDSEIKVGDGEQWIGCDGCKEWYHYACAGFNSEREVRDVNKFYCGPCRPKFGETTSRSTDAQRRYNSNLVQRFASPSESTRQLTMPVSTKVSSRLPMTTPSITTSPLSRMET